MYRKGFKHIIGRFIEHFHRQVCGGIFVSGSPLSDKDGFHTDSFHAFWGGVKFRLRALIQRYNNSFHADFCGFRRRSERLSIFSYSPFAFRGSREDYVCCNPPFL
jgi:hypothetical protein